MSLAYGEGVSGSAPSGAPTLFEQDGETRRDRGMARAAEASGTWFEAAKDAIEYLARTGREFTSEELRERVGDPPRPNAMGPVFMWASRQKLIKRVGDRPARRPSLHATNLPIWKGTAA